MVLYKRCYFIFLIGGAGYSLIEILWRGYTHPSMALVGGLCMVAIYFINGLFSDKPRALRAIICAAAISLIELISGIIINVVLRLGVWDYSEMPFNFKGQICLVYSFLWFLLSYFILYVLDKVRM